MRAVWTILQWIMYGSLLSRMYDLGLESLHPLQIYSCVVGNLRCAVCILLFAEQKKPKHFTRIARLLTGAVCRVTSYIVKLRAKAAGARSILQLSRRRGGGGSLHERWRAVAAAAGDQQLNATCTRQDWNGGTPATRCDSSVVSESQPQSPTWPPCSRSVNVVGCRHVRFSQNVTAVVNRRSAAESCREGRWQQRLIEDHHQNGARTPSWRLTRLSLVYWALKAKFNMFCTAL